MKRTRRSRSRSPTRSLPIFRLRFGHRETKKIRAAQCCAVFQQLDCGLLRPTAIKTLPLVVTRVRKRLSASRIRTSTTYYDSTRPLFCNSEYIKRCSVKLVIGTDRFGQWSDSSVRIPSQRATSRTLESKDHWQ